jgi:hypothetical protein
LLTVLRKFNICFGEAVRIPLAACIGTAAFADDYRADASLLFFPERN